MRRLVSGAVAVALLALPGCVAPDQQERASGPSASPWGGPTSPGAPTSPGPATSPEAPSDVSALLRSRADAVRSGDRSAFLAPVRGAGLRAEQARLFDNLRRLPIADLSYAVEGGAVLRDLRLTRADTGPSRSPTGLRVVPTDRGPVLERGAAGTEPWDLAEIRVRRAPGVLLVHDRASAGQAAAVSTAVARGRGPVSRAVGRSFAGPSVVYLFRDPAVLAAFRGPSAAPGVVAAIALRARDSAGQQVGTRIALLPDGADLPTSDRARLLRHELVHVLLPEGDDAPLWLIEGLAEHLGHRAVPRRQQRIASSAIDRARRGLTALPSPQDFAGAAGLAAYDIAWMAAEQIAADAGTDALVAMTRRLAAPTFGDAEPDVDRALREVLGYDERELARRTGDRILRRFGG